MLKKTFFAFLLILFFLPGCGDDDYKVEYDENKVKFYYENKKIIFENNLEIPVVMDHIRVNDREVENFIKYKVCEYIKYKDIVVVNYKDKLNQIIYLTSIVLPGKKKEIDFILKKDDEVELEFYVVNYNFLSDNVYFINKKIYDNEKKYKLYRKDDIINLNIENLEKKEEINILYGIMIFVKEYEALEDYLEEIDFEIE